MDMMWYRRRGLMVTPHIERVTGAIASFNSDYNKIPVKSLICDIEPIQEGTGDPSPENVRPIIGWTGLSVTRCGKNLLEWINQSTTIRGVTFTTNADGSILCNGTAIGDASFYSKTPSDIPIKPGAYILSGCPVGGSSTTFLMNETIYAKTDYGNGVTIITNDTKPNIRVRIVIRNGYTADNLLFKPMLRLSSDTDATFEPYKGNTYSVNWETEAGTVYGGTLDIVSGKLTVDRAKVTYNGSEAWENRSTSYGFYTRVLLNNSGVTGQSALSNFLKWNSGTAPANLALGEFLLGTYINVRPQEGITNVTDWKNYLASTNLEICYLLTSPVVMILQPIEITTLLGVNNIWSDGGDVTVDYWKWGK